jgi:hypothetical protein
VGQHPDAEQVLTLQPVKAIRCVQIGHTLWKAGLRKRSIVSPRNNAKNTRRVEVRDAHRDQNERRKDQTIQIAEARHGGLDVKRQAFIEMPARLLVDLG